MKNSFSILGTVLAGFLLASTSFAAEKPGASSSDSRLSKSLGEESATTVMSANQLSLWVTKHGEFPPGYSACQCASTEYPIGGPGMMYQEGFLYGAKVDDAGYRAGTLHRVRVSGATHAHGMKAGKVRYDAGGVVNGYQPADSAQVWKVRIDWPTADLTGDAAAYNAIPAEDVTDAHEQEMYDSYEYDWANWPTDLGAPYEDLDGVAGYTPATWNADSSKWLNGDIPGYPGASSTVWTVANDLPRADGTEVATDAYGSPGVGVEIQFTIWAYAFAADNPLGNMIFKRFRMIYTGRQAETDAKLDTVYFVNWSDPDLGNYSDDYVGCDTLLSLGYVYNANTLDDISYGDYGLPVAAGGYDFLQGPVSAAGDTMGMTSFTFFGAGSAIEDPDQYIYDGSLQYFNLMEGFLPRPAYPVQEAFTDPLTLEATKFVLAGDPVTGSGWNDGLTLPPGDRRLVMSTGPFQMELGDTVDIVVALISGMGGDNLSSVTVLKYYDLFAQYAYDNDFDLPSPPTMPKVVSFTGDGYVSLFWGQDPTAVAATEKIVRKGFQFEGYNVYQLPNAAATPGEGTKIATFDLANGVTTILEKMVDRVTGQILEVPAQTGGDVEFRRDLVAERDVLRNRPITNDIPYFFGVSAYSFLPNAEEVGSPFQSLESGMTVVIVWPQEVAPGETVDETIAGTLVDAEHTGTADGFVRIYAINPADFTGHDYEVYFDLQHYYMDLDGQWKFTNYPDSVGKALGKVFDLTGTTVSAIAYTSPTAGTRDLKFIVDLVAPDYDYSDGLSLTFPPGIVINSAEDAVGNVYGTTYHPVVDTDANTVVWGGPDTTGDGDFSGGEVFSVNVETPTLPLDVEYIVWDDGWAVSYGEPYASMGAGVVHAVGTCTITEEAYAFKTEKYWNLKDVTTGEVLFEDMGIMNGTDIYTGETWDPSEMPIVDGFRPNVSVGYVAPLDAARRVPTGTGSYDIDSYWASGWAESSAMASDPECWGCGTDDIGLLQRDIELRFTGVYDDPDTTITGTDTLIVHPIQEGTGSIATFVGMRNPGDVTIADHPLNPTGLDEYFPIRIPFEVWDLDAEGGPEQIDILVYDRIQFSGGLPITGDFYAFNPYDRMYCHFLHRAYSADTADVNCDTGADAEFLTWNIVFWETDWDFGDVVWFQYDNPIILGVDKWTFTPAARTTGGDITADDIERINVFPNPYYGYQVLERARAAKWMRFNHLPTDREVIIRIFNLGGVMVRTILKPANDGTQYTDWNLLNQAGYPVASGIYIAYIEVDGADEAKVLKLAIVQEIQILDVY